MNGVHTISPYQDAYLLSRCFDMPLVLRLKALLTFPSLAHFIVIQPLVLSSCMSLKPPEGKSRQTPALRPCHPISFHFFRHAFLQLIQVVTDCQSADIPTGTPVRPRYGCRARGGARRDLSIRHSWRDYHVSHSPFLREGYSALRVLI